MSETISAPFRGVDLGLPVKPITLADATSAMGQGATRTPGVILVDIPAALSKQQIVVSQWGIAANLVLSRIFSQLAAPVMNPVVLNNVATWNGATGVTFWVVTALDAAGQTQGSNEVSLNMVHNAVGIAHLSWSPVPGASTYNLYRATVSGGELTSPALVTSGIISTSFDDVGNAVTAGAAPATNGTGNNPSALTQFGRLGRLIGGPLRHRAVQTTGTGISAATVAPWETPFAFPDDISNLASIWDGSVDMSPSMENWTAPLPVNLATTLNSPITLAANEQLGICLGLTPTVGQNVALYVVNGRWSLTYDFTSV